MEGLCLLGARDLGCRDSLSGSYTADGGRHDILDIERRREGARFFVRECRRRSHICKMGYGVACCSMPRSRASDESLKVLILNSPKGPRTQIIGF